MGFLLTGRGIRSIIFGFSLALATSLGMGACGARTELPPGELTSTTPDAGQQQCTGSKVQGVRVGGEQQMDLLFVIDNSASMNDKQVLLSDAVPGMVRRLANPLCVSLNDPSIERQVGSAEEPCPAGFRREFEALTDLHIGVITSALGTAGGGEQDSCATGPGHELADDQAHLVATLERGLSIPSYQNAGFLAWDPLQQALPAGESDITRLEQNFRSMVSATGETGCGLEQPLESMYRFLIDPTPPANVVVNSGFTQRVGRDEVLLAQRAKFLRPDSLVAIVLLSDENDCSIVTADQGWLVGKYNLNGMSFRFPRSTSVCESDPNNVCCRSCAANESSPPSGCSRVMDDPRCKEAMEYGPTEDPVDLRCYDQKRRFGIDLLFPTARYAVGLRNRTLCPDSIYHDGDCECTFAKERARRLGRPTPSCTSKETGAPRPNPLFSNLSGVPAFERDTSQVFLAGIVGVPWQDLATPATLNDPNRLEYLTAPELSRVDPVLGVNRWQIILGDPITHTPPLDPFMRESVQPRSGQNPITRDMIVGVDSTNPRANAINGHERVTDVGLQYACTFPLREPRPCDIMKRHCDCPADPDAHSDTDSVCQPPAGGKGGTTQYYAKAYPGLREIDVLRQHGDNSVVASICPKVLSGGTEELGFGYRPALSGLIKRIHCTTLNGRFEDDPASQNFGSVDCRLVSVRQLPAGSGTDACNCGTATRIPLDSADARALKAELTQRGTCGPNTAVDCNTLCACQIPQATSAALRACQNDDATNPIDPDTGAPINAWCYVSPEQGFGAPSLVNQCPAGRRQNLRLLGSAFPTAQEHLFAVCGEPCPDTK
ncbi:MAG: hypothetical protein ACOY0T_41140 [Myxococcota bacterium]